MTKHRMRRHFNAKRIFALQAESTAKRVEETVLWLGGVFIGGALVATVTIVVGLGGNAYSFIYWLLVAVNALLGALNLLLRKRLTVPILHVELVAAIIGVSTAVFESHFTDPAIMTIVFYFWLLLFAFSFLSLSGGVLYSVLTVIGFVIAVSFSSGFTTPLADSLFFAGTVVITGIFLRRLVAQLALQSYEDELTGLPNRRYFELQCRQLLGPESFTDETVGLALIDQDDFKHINDSLGHLQGDRTLVELSSLWRPVIRKGDVLARWGGDEFILLTFGSSEEELLALLGRLFDLASNHLSISVGYGIRDRNETYEDLLAKCDRALYRAKERADSERFEYAMVNGSNLD